MYSIIDLPKINDNRGNLSFLESQKHIPFEIKRIYWIYDVPGGAYRGAHAFKKNEEFIIALSGSFDLIVDNGKESNLIQLNRSNRGVLVSKMVWRQLENFSTNSLALILSSVSYNENDYIRNYDEFQSLLK